MFIGLTDSHQYTTLSRDVAKLLLITFNTLHRNTKRELTMYISRIVIRNFRNFVHFDSKIGPDVTTIIGENNTGKTNLMHAIQRVIDSNLSSRYRKLQSHDINTTVDRNHPFQVVISVEFTDYEENLNERALVGEWEASSGKARITYRFLPKRTIREAILSGERSANNLTLEDYGWEIVGGGSVDPATVEWNEDIGLSVRFADLQYFQVVFMHALRDVRGELRHERKSPLAKLISASEFSEADKSRLVDIITSSNEQISNEPIISTTSQTIEDSFKQTVGDVYNFSVKLGMSDPSFDSIASALKILLSTTSFHNFETDRNGLGLNNILYISMLLVYLEKRIAQPDNAGQLLLIEEPEAHLHPQLQRVLYQELASRGVQVLISTHSTHISSQAKLESVVLLTANSSNHASTIVMSEDRGFSQGQIDSLERYLDATRSTLLYASRIILVEGVSEMFLIPPLVKSVMHVDFDRKGIAIIPIHGTHFDVYAKLFSSGFMRKKCAIIADGDLQQSQLNSADDQDEDTFSGPEFDSLISENVNVFRCRTTFERAITIPPLLRMLVATTEDCGAPQIAGRLRNGDERIRSGISDAESATIIEELRTRVLRTAIRFGKGRFAQAASKHVGLAEALPEYISQAMDWLLEE